MNPITEKDMKFLRKNASGKMRLLSHITILFSIAALLAAGVAKVYFCARFSALAGVSTKSVILDWFAGLDPISQYSGVYIYALSNWGDAFLYFSETGVLVLVYVIFCQTSKRNVRILKFIESQTTTQTAH